VTEAPKHTRGPWHYEPDGMGDFTIASERDQLAIAAVVNGSFMAMGGHADEHEANARLIAAAPDMLAALRECQSTLAMIIAPDAGKRTSALHAFAQATAAEAKARAAISKAEGPRS
jgi:hypothetical protein